MRERQKYGDAPPPGMLRVVNDEMRARFRRDIVVVAARVQKSRVQALVRELNGKSARLAAAGAGPLLLRLPKVRGVVEIGGQPHSDDRLVLLEQRVTIDPTRAAGEPAAEGSVVVPGAALAGASDAELELLGGSLARFQHHTITLGYKDCSVDQVLRELLPSVLISSGVGGKEEEEEQAKGEDARLQRQTAGVDDGGDDECAGPASVPSSFETVGHIAHLNLRDEFMPYKRLICEVILDKHWPQIRTVVNKVGVISDRFRVLPLEIVCGIEDTNTSVRQHGASFSMDYAAVYWNSRLEREHQRLVALFSNSEVVADAMAGIGPFAVPSALKGCTVYANDLNPASYEYLRRNTRINKVSHKVASSCADARRFIRHVLSSTLLSSPSSTATSVVPRANTPESATGGEIGAGGDGLPQLAQPITRLIMNLPASAVEFLDCIADAMKSYNNAHAAISPCGANALPFVHVYTFLKSTEEEADESKAKRDAVRGVKTIVEGHLGCAIDEQRDEYSVHVVRDVAPKKVMACVSFRIPIELLPASARARPAAHDTAATNGHGTGNGGDAGADAHASPKRQRRLV